MTMLNVAIAEDNPKTMEVLNEMLEKNQEFRSSEEHQTGLKSFGDDQNDKA